MTFKSGFVAIVGRPNAGKSTLLNQILKMKVAITSNTAQTTRTTLQGIYNSEEAQVVFIDTPGIHSPKDLLGSFMNTTAINATYGTDIVLFVAAGNEKAGAQEKYILEKLKEQDAPVFLVLNKIDTLKKEKLIEKLNEWSALYPFDEVIPVSAKDDKNVDTLLKVILEHLEEGVPFYDEETLTDHSNAYHCAEMIREKILRYTSQEIPHEVAITIEKFSEEEDHYDVMATIIVDRASQKGILIGKQGAMISKIRTNARKSMKQFLGKRVDLELFIRVEKGWRNKQLYLKEFGYNEEEY